MKRRRSAAKAAIVVGLQLLLQDAAAARDRQFEIVNDTPLPIYKLFIWPTELIPRTYNVINTPIRSNETRTIEVEDIYNDCIYTIQADTTEPPRKTRLPSWKVRKKRLGKVYWVQEANLCKPDPKIVIE